MVWSTLIFIVGPKLIARDTPGLTVQAGGLGVVAKDNGRRDKGLRQGTPPIRLLQ